MRRHHHPRRSPILRRLLDAAGWLALAAFAGASLWLALEAGRHLSDHP